MFVITKDSNNKPYNKSSVSKIIIIKSHWLEKKPPFNFSSKRLGKTIIITY